MKILSLIVPSYNSEKFLDKCILSFCDETVLDELDIIIVNDGSRDATADVARKYCQMYPDSIRLISQENKGHGGALNTGFSAAKGKYLKPIDADDWIESRNLPALIDALRNCDSDVLLTHYHVIDISNGSISEMKSCPEKYGRAMTIDELMSQWGSFFRVATFHGIAYNRQFYQKHNNALTEHVFYEDNEYSTIPFCYAKTIMPLDLFIYEYRVGDVTQSIAVDNQVKRLDHIQAVIERMLQVYCQLPEGAGRQYVAAKTQAVGMMYLTTALLAHPDKKTGRQLAQDRMAAFKNTAPAIYDMLAMKYRVYKLLSALHISKQAWDRFLNSRIYNRLRSR
jgi:glycosyltransferase involved in cell wall biosynthesis